MEVSVSPPPKCKLGEVSAHYAHLTGQAASIIQGMLSPDQIVAAIAILQAKQWLRFYEAGPQYETEELNAGSN